MKVLTSIFRKSRNKTFILSVLSNIKCIGQLSICFFFPLISSCVVLWPLHADRDYSLSEDENRQIRDIDPSYVINLYELSRLRYLELKNAGGEYCFPGQMRIIQNKHQLIEYEIDGDLFGDASNRLTASFSSLEKVRTLMEEMAEDGGCTLKYAAGLIKKGEKPLRSDDSILGLSDWPRPMNLRIFMRSK
ncbi:hypothetical protein [Endozoicomonas sp.]|uniref:hypothetical protein n=1 Tax=Endozoicomonas sp. TaxID=1892382 RepID=UPI002886E8BB|nr:hypothetical protein [Endozoicomonas sp.]